MNKQMIHRKRLLNASPERVFSLWTEPASIRQWFGGLQTEVQDVSFDLRPGGQYSIQVNTEQGASTITGEFLEVEEPARLVYTWELESPQGTMPSTTVEVEFRGRDGQTEVVLSHGPFLDPEVKVFHGDGWQACFEGLEVLLSS